MDKQKVRKQFYLGLIVALAFTYSKGCDYIRTKYFVPSENSTRIEENVMFDMYSDNNSIRGILKTLNSSKD